MLYLWRNIYVRLVILFLFLFYGFIILIVRVDRWCPKLDLFLCWMNGLMIGYDQVLVTFHGFYQILYSNIFAGINITAMRFDRVE